MNDPIRLKLTNTGEPRRIVEVEVDEQTYRSLEQADPGRIAGVGDQAAGTIRRALQERRVLLTAAENRELEQLEDAGELGPNADVPGNAFDPRNPDTVVPPPPADAAPLPSAAEPRPAKPPVVQAPPAPPPTPGIGRPETQGGHS